MANQILDRSWLENRAGVDKPCSCGWIDGNESLFGIQPSSRVIPFNGYDRGRRAGLGLVWPQIRGSRVRRIRAIFLFSGIAGIDSNGPLVLPVMPAEILCSKTASSVNILVLVVVCISFGRSEGGVAIGDNFDDDRGSADVGSGESLAVAEVVLLGLALGAFVVSGFSWAWAGSSRVSHFWALAVWAWSDWVHRTITFYF
ncbi:hypothetical protein RchiOBHm_Chr1g0334151 [Rosa chinensis]|uniref:Uncharacterized protein n=1 Tax=Rosa chinensis TaxID=74649 RepID=A0A2P6SC77_ROSCH|nr:hypothetical protein RchiOBHm_Chr1g0334151 [Rosa chinensis]